MNAGGTGVQLGVVLLCHDDLHAAARMARIWADGGARVVIHVDAKAPGPAFDGMVQALRDQPLIRFAPRRACNWGRFDLVQATLDATRLLLDDCPEVSHVYLASGACLPLRPVAELTAYLRRNPARDHIESVAVDEGVWAVGGLNKERFTRYFPFDWRHQRWLFDRALALQRRLRIHRRLPEGLVPHLGAQWWCLTRATLQAILSDPRRAEFDRFFRLTWIPDEAYFQTLARRHSAQIESRSLTLARFDDRGRPYLLYDDHLQMLAESGCFVARKVWPGAKGLLAHFPHARAPGPVEPRPGPARIERLFNRATALATSGRPGVYSQGRFPRIDAESRKTAAPYAVFHGFDDAIPGFEDWLAGQVDADIHGHLFSPGGAEFAGRPAIGPGALSRGAKLRDYDPQAFLTALIRSGTRMQVFQHGPQDRQALNGFLASDAHARLLVLTGAWAVPLSRSDLPFDRISRLAARLHRAEIEAVRMLKASWCRAGVQIWDLAEFAADPAPVIASALNRIDPPPARMRPLPPLPDLSELGDFLQRLRNAGLGPALTGHFPLTEAPTRTQTPTQIPKGRHP